MVFGLELKRGTFNNSSSRILCSIFSKSSDSEGHTSQDLGTIIVETSQKISPIEDGRDQKEGDQTEDSQMQGKEMVRIYSNTDGKTPKVYDTVLLNYKLCF